MSSSYPILNDRPIDQWKVTELKEELRKRSLKINGLKEELVRRLADALNTEMEDAEKEDAEQEDAEQEDGEKEVLGNGTDTGNDPDDKVDVEESAPVTKEYSSEQIRNEINEETSAPLPPENSAEPVEDTSSRADNDAVMEEAEKEDAEKEDDDKEELGNGTDPGNDPDDKVDVEESAPEPKEYSAEQIRDEVDEKNSPPENSAEHVEDTSSRADNDAVMVDNTNSTLDTIQITGDQGQKEMGQANLDSVVEDSTDNAVPLENSTTDSQTGVIQAESNDKGTRTDEKNEDSKPSAEDAALNAPEPTNQVSEVSTGLGFQVKSDSISTDSVSINEKNELKDNLNANNVHLELEVVKPEMVQPSSSAVPTIGGDSHQLEDDKELVDNQASFEGAGDVTCATVMEVCKKIEGVDEGSPEKLNLDRSSGDESMEEDVLETKQTESKDNSEEGERKEDILEVANPIDALISGFSPVKKDMASKEEPKPTATVEKRKAEDQDATNINNEPKRQRRWNSDPVKAVEMQTSKVPSSSPKDAFQPALRRSFTRTDSSLSGDSPKERIVPPSQKPTTSSLRIDRFLRPFTLKAVQELLAKTGTVSAFWMDQIKTHCYVTYSSVEEAVATRNALYNLQWPPNGGRQLVAEFVDPQEVKVKLEAPPQSPAPITPGPTAPTAAPFQRQPQALPPPPPPPRLPPPPPLPLPPPPALANPPPVKERLPPPPPMKKAVEPPVMTLDDLFKKTKATPRIYYLPLSEEQVAARVAGEQGKKRAM